MKLIVYIEVIKNGINALKMTFFSSRRDRYGYIDKSAIVCAPSWGIKQNAYLYEETCINSFSNFITPIGKFILKKGSRIGQNVTIITANHSYENIGEFPASKYWHNYVYNEVIVNEDVWIGANVTLCPGVTIGRGSIVAAGSVCVGSKEYPPYSIIGGNPAKFIRFRLILEDQIEQEKLRFGENERIPVEILRQNYERFKK